jgi:sensor histidine kinase YesM
MPFIERLINFNKRHRVLSHFLFWICLYVLLMFRFDPYDRYNHTLWYDMLDWGICISVSALYAYYISYRFIPRLFNSQRYFPIILEFIVLSYIIAAAMRIVVVHFLEPITRKAPFNQEPVLEILFDVGTLFHGYLLHIIAISFFFVFIKLVKDQYQGNKRTLQLEKQKSDSELAALKAQLNPHFLFNTLNNIYSLTLLKSPAAPEAVAKLSNILDHLLYRCGDMYVPVSKEIMLLQNYIDLEKMRYDERLQVNFRHHTDRDAGIAPLILLSLVENAFKHGAGEDAGNPVIDINLHLENNSFLFEVSNSVQAPKEKGSNERIGLANIRKQLELIYPGIHTFKTSLQDGRFTASLQINLPGDQP